MIRPTLCLAAALLTLAACTSTSPIVPALPTRYVMAGPTVYPEAVAVDASGGFVFASSSDDGTVYRAATVGEGSVEMTPFLAAGGDGRTAAYGPKMAAAPSRTRAALYVAGGSTRFGLAYDPDSGVLLARCVAPPPAPGDSSFINDVAVLPDGSTVWTDSYRPVLWRGAPGGGALDPWIDLTTTPIIYRDGFNLNGIVLAGSGTVLVTCQTATGQLWRVDLATREVSLVTGAALDGMRLAPDGRTLYVVDGGARVAVLRLSPDARTAERVSPTRPSGPPSGRPPHGR